MSNILIEDHDDYDVVLYIFLSDCYFKAQLIAACVNHALSTLKDSVIAD